MFNFRGISNHDVQTGSGSDQILKTEPGSGSYHILKTGSGSDLILKTRIRIQPKHLNPAGSGPATRKMIVTTCRVDQYFITQIWIRTEDNQL